MYNPYLRHAHVVFSELNEGMQKTPQSTIAPVNGGVKIDVRGGMCEFRRSKSPSDAARALEAGPEIQQFGTFTSESPPILELEP